MGIFSRLFGRKSGTAVPRPTDEAAAARAPSVSLVALRLTPRFIHAPEVEKIAHQLFGFVADEGNPQATEFIVSKHATTAISTQGWLIMVHSPPVPYFDDPQAFAAQASELRMRDAILNHTGWTSVDIMQMPPGVDRQAAYRRAAMMLAELLDDSCTMLFVPEYGRAIPFNVNMVEDVRNALRAENTFAALHDVMQVRVVQASGEDARMQAAVAEARRRYPEFVRAFNAGKGNAYSVKAPITVADNTEFIWIEVQAANADVVRGKLANEPINLGALRIGDEVEVPAAELNDWAFMHENQMVGGFTVKLLMEQ